MYRRYYVYLKDRSAPVKVLVNIGTAKRLGTPLKFLEKQ